MNAGFSNLATLKRELLLADDAASSSFDDSLVAYGRGVAGMFEAYCGRRFTRVEGDVASFAADVRYIALPRYPVEAVTFVEVQTDLQTGFVIHADEPRNFRRESGLVFFQSYLGSCEETARVTWTGGYFIETREPGEEGFGEVPAGAEVIPDALVLAWINQTKWLWDRANIELRAKAGFENAMGTDKGFLAPGEDLLQHVKLALAPFRRLAA